VLKQLGYDDARIEALVNLISASSYFDKYADGLQLEPDVTPAKVTRRMVTV
jgi:hypothetical protein